MPQRRREAESFGETGGIDVHDHIHQCLHLRRTARAADKAAVHAHLLDQRLHLLINGLIASEHQVEFALARVADAAGHAGLQAVRACFFRRVKNLAEHRRGKRGAIHEDLALRVHEQVVARVEIDRAHRHVVRDHGENDIGRRSDIRQLRAGLAAQLGGQIGRRLRIHVHHRGHAVTTIFETTRHVRAHFTDSDKSDCLGHKDEMSEVVGMK